MSSDRQRLLDFVAKAVSDGSAVNWDEANSEASDPETRDMLRHLRVVAEIADLHRKTVDEEPAAGSASSIVGLTANAPPHQPLAVSDTWAHLTLREVIGRGAYGTVYRAWDAQLDRDLALKL